MYEHMRGLRDDNDISQIQMAEFLQVHQTTYSDYELGKINIPIPILKRIAERFQTSIDYLVDFTNEVTPYPRKKE